MTHENTIAIKEKKGIVIPFFKTKNNIDNETNKLSKAMEDALDELKYAELLFNNVTDDDLIDVAIYQMNAARSKMDYIIKKASENHGKQKAQC